MGSTDSARGKGHTAPRGTFRECKRPQIFSSYVSSMSHIIDTEPSYHGEVAGQQFVDIMVASGGMNLYCDL
jgi:hypothetical protein